MSRIQTLGVLVAVFLAGASVGAWVRNGVAIKQVEQASALLTVANGQIADLRETIATRQRVDDVQGRQADRQREAVVRTDTKRKASRQAIPPMPDTLPRSCDPCLARATALQAALADAEIHIDTLNGLLTLESERARELRAGLDLVADSLAAAQRTALAAERKLVTIRRVPARLLAIGRIETARDRPVEAMAGIEVPIAGQVAVYGGMVRDFETGQQRGVLGLQGRVRLW